MLVEGKSLQEWANAPAGAFTSAVRKTIDPHWGRETDGMKRWRCKATLTKTTYDYETIDIEAFTKEEARDAAYKQLDGDRYDDCEIDVYEVAA